MTIQCDHIIDARRPDIVVVEKDSNKAIIVRWLHHGITEFKITRSEEGD